MLEIILRGKQLCTEDFIRVQKINDSSQVQGQKSFVNKLKAIKNTMEVFHLFILKLWS